MVRSPWSYLHTKYVMNTEGSNGWPINIFTDYFLFEPKIT